MKKLEKSKQSERSEWSEKSERSERSGDFGRPGLQTTDDESESLPKGKIPFFGFRGFGIPKQRGSIFFQPDMGRRCGE